MKREILGGKIHRARVTQTDLEYEGSCAIDTTLLEAAGILPYERIHIYNVATGTRFDTYAIPAPAGSGTIGLNGAAARLANVGDLVIIVTFVQLDDTDTHGWQPRVVLVDKQNKPVRTKRHSGDRSN